MKYTPLEVFMLALAVACELLAVVALCWREWYGAYLLFIIGLGFGFVFAGLYFPRQWQR